MCHWIDVSQDKVTTILLVVAGLLTLRDPPPPLLAVEYEVSFQATWSGTTHPGAFPAGANFSPLIGATHNDQASFWEVGGLATEGIERMAESGTTSILTPEF